MLIQPDSNYIDMVNMSMTETQTAPTNYTTTPPATAWRSEVKQLIMYREKRF